MRTGLTIVLLASILMVGVSCKKDNGTGHMTVRMKDAPIDFQEVNVEILDVQIHYSNSAPGSDAGWVSLDTDAGIYNLLELQDSVTAVLSDYVELPAGHVQQMRLILGSNNTVMVDSVVYDLQMTSQMNSGLKFNLNVVIGESDEVEVLFDFDAEQSIVIDGTSSFKLKPVIKVVGISYL